jgi:predicted transposase YbfD/YdcC
MTVFSLLNKKYLERWLLSWTSGYLEELKNELIAIDGKALKGASRGGKREGTLYLLNAFATGQGLLIGHHAIAQKTNEITAIPKLLDELSIEGAIVSIDAIGCQKNIAEKVIDKKADYFLALKGNQGGLFADVVTFFEGTIKSAENKLFFAETVDKGHGRLEIRRCWSSNDIQWLSERNPGWEKLSSICMVESERHIKGEIERERRYYISSRNEDAKQLLSYSRRHWAIENNLHWVLDVQLNEDAAQIRANNAAENMGVVRKIVFNLIKHYQKKFKDPTAISSLRMASGWNDNIAASILGGLAC